MSKVAGRNYMIAIIIIGSIVGIILGLLFMASLLSFKSPKEGTIQIITRFGKFYDVIMSIDGYRVNKPGTDFVEKDKDGKPAEEWDIIPAEDKYTKSSAEESNIYFFLWPIYKTYQYEFSYTKQKKIGEEKPGDHILWKDESIGQCVVSREGISNHIKFQVEYPTITGNLLTAEMGKVIVFTNNVIQAVNPYKMMFRIDSWFGLVNDTIGAALKGLVANIPIDELNKIQSEDQHKAKFVEKMKEVNAGIDADHLGINKFGVKLTKSAYKAFQPADDNCKTLVESFSKGKIAEEIGKGSIETAKAEKEVSIKKAEGEAKAFEINQEQFVKWKKKYLVDTGLAKVNDKGDIIELVPDANTRLTTEAIKALSNLKGTLVLDSTDLQKMLNISNNNIS